MKPDQLTINRQLRRGGFGRYYEGTSSEKISENTIEILCIHSEEPIDYYSITFKEPRPDRPEIIALLKTIVGGSLIPQNNWTSLYKMYTKYTSTFILSDTLDYYEDHTRI